MKKKINWNKEIIKEKVSKILTIIWRVLLIIILGFILVGYLYQCSNNAKKLENVTTNNELINRYDRDNYQIKNSLDSTNSFLILYTDKGIVVNDNIVDSSTDVTTAFGGQFNFNYWFDNVTENSFDLRMYSEFYFLSDQYPLGYYNNNSSIQPSFRTTLSYYGDYTYTFNHSLADFYYIEIGVNVFNDVATNYYNVHVNLTPKLINVENGENVILQTASPFENVINCSLSYNNFPSHLDEPNSPYSILNLLIPPYYRFEVKSLINGIYDNGYNDGFAVGKEYGTELGYNNGYDDGVVVGETNAGIAENGFITMFNIILTAPFNIFNGLLNFELFGVNLFNVFSFIITAFLVIWIIKRFV